MATVLLFGPLGDMAGWRQRDFAAAADLDGLQALIAALDPDLALALTGPGVQIAVDKALVRGNITLTANAEVAFLPPMSGG